MSDTNDKKGQFLYVTPVTGVYLGEETRGEYRIDKVTLFRRDRFLRTRRYNFVYRNWRSQAANCNALSASSVVAVVPAGGTPEEARRYGHGAIKDELSILSSARLGYHGRDNRGVVGIAGCLDSYNTNDLLLGQNVDLMQASCQQHGTDELRITDEFIRGKRLDQVCVYRRLLRIIRGQHGVDKKWSGLLRNAAILAGRSQNAIETADAFLWDIIALEQLLLGEKERSGHQSKLSKRCQALFGYCPLWEKLQLEKALTKVYEARCRLVHEGDRKSISLEHVIIADLFLANVIGSLVLNLTRIPSKGALIDHAEKASARAVLGMDPRGKRWRWHFSFLCYREERVKEFWAL